MKNVLTYIICLLITVTTYSQKINWISFDELPNKMRVEKKPFMVFVYADWCKICHMQLNTTFKDKEFVNKLNADYYALKLDATSKENIIFLGKEYHYKSTGDNTGEHELAKFLGTKKGIVTYPTTLFFNSSFQVKHQLIGLQKASSLTSLMFK